MKCGDRRDVRVFQGGKQTCKGQNVPERRITLSLSLFAVAMSLLPQWCSAQESNRSYQQLSGHVFRNAREAAKPADQNYPSHPQARRFTGWQHADKLGPDYRKRFTRQRARSAKAELLTKAANHANLPSRPAAQFPPSALPGLLLRDSLPAGYIPTSTVAGDFNGDGKLDFAVANGGDNNLWLYFGKGDGTFNLPIILPITQGMTPTWIATGDLRGIGRTDLVVAEPDSNSVGIFLSNGDGTFAENSISIPGAATTLVVGDFNHDGKLDIVAPLDDGNSNVIIVMLPGLGNGTFGTPVTTHDSRFAPWIFYASSADLNDVNGDGHIDVIASGIFMNDLPAYGTEAGDQLCAGGPLPFNR